MTGRPNLFQRLLHRFVMLRPVTDFFAPRVHRADNAILNLTGGRFSLSRLLGWRIIQLTTFRASSRRPRTIPLLAVFDDDRIALIASSFGRPQNPNWYYNLKSTPDCIVRYNGESKLYSAREAEGDERDKYWGMAVAAYAGYEKYRARAGRMIPIILLEPKRSQTGG